jgi:hypothetical protein
MKKFMLILLVCTQVSSGSWRGRRAVAEETSPVVSITPSASRSDSASDSPSSSFRAKRSVATEQGSPVGSRSLQEKQLPVLELSLEGCDTASACKPGSFREKRRLPIEEGSPINSGRQRSNSQTSASCERSNSPLLVFTGLFKRLGKESSKLTEQSEVLPMSGQPAWGMLLEDLKCRTIQQELITKRQLTSAYDLKAKLMAVKLEDCHDLITEKLADKQMTVPEVVKATQLGLNQMAIKNDAVFNKVQSAEMRVFYQAAGNKFLKDLFSDIQNSPLTIELTPRIEEPSAHTH